MDSNVKIYALLNKLKNSLPFGLLGLHSLGKQQLLSVADLLTYPGSQAHPITHCIVHIVGGFSKLSHVRGHAVPQPLYTWWSGHCVSEALKTYI